MKIRLKIDNGLENVLKIQEMFGISESNFKEIRFPEEVDKIKDSNITFITGPSGSGKTSLGKYIKEKLGYVENNMYFDKQKPIIDSLSGSFRQTLYYLNMVGLAEAFIYLTPYLHLSEGQKFRFEMAYILSQGKDYILIDEFCSLLDRETAKIVSYNLQKIIRKFNKHIIVISSHKDIVNFLSPDILVEFDDYGNSNLQQFSKIELFDIYKLFKVKEGNYDEFKLLERFHYFGNVTHNTLKRRNAKYYSLYKDEKLMGILVTTSPYPKDNNELEREFVEINDNIRIIFRLILHPKVRGIGITRFLYNEVLKEEKSILFLRSALAKKYPFPQKLNMTKVNYDNILSFQEYQMMLNIKKYSCKKSFQFGRYILSKMMFRDFVKYNNIMGTKTSGNINIYFFYKIIKNVFPKNDDLDLLENVIKPVEMEDYYFDNR